MSNKPQKREWTVRVVQMEADGHGRRQYVEKLSGTWLECLRYMGHAKELKHITDDGPERVVMEFYAPRGTDSLVWAEQNAERMQTFGINAVAAPKWDVDQPLEK